ncbi:beta,beta-carotene 9',10'-dioxygenase [Cucurbitaria berberidis CBS 394.84]|uniref:Beta,beta-carotene 9',10'-dioxygenase n=1 Tax=Cucurbitaria berberidis CBS 394.84 TaxID=1168544 RepID=A0A9P4L7F7_9PLEO|nr:beta,beta-carotene 9',10'-dioxygenase [Cucurbitaria berberidis CBS 394.84]KAF1844264.1 beta,beta-carotene 9',10'-dioxygenase [Cucurbitaria berberidis CBS 394.84]
MVAAVVDSWPNDAGFDNNYEEHKPVELVVKGNIPTYAAGVLYRTGPLGYKAKTDDGKIWAAKHWFDGFSCVHRFQVDFLKEDGPAKVQYRSRRIVDEYLEVVRKTGKLDSVTFASKRDPCESFFKKVMSIFYASQATRNARNAHNVGVTLSINMPGGGYVKNPEKPSINGHTNHIETLHAKTDAFLLNKIDPETLEPQGIATQTVLHPELKGPMSAAHAKSDPETGDIFNFNLDLGYKSTYRVFRTSASTGKTEILARFNGKPAYIHSLFLTENYVVLCVWNSHITWSGISLLYKKNIVDSIAPFDPKSKAMWYVVDRTHGKGLVATYESDPFFCFHSVNAWEEPDETDPKKTDIITELSMFENTDVIHRFYYDNLVSSIANPEYMGKKRTSCLPMQTQFRLPRVNVSVSTGNPRPAEIVFQADKMISMELPTINPSYLTHRHRYSYGCADRLKSSFMDGIVKFDNLTQKSIFWEVEGHTPGEPIFVADPEGKAEDDGVLLTVVLDGYVERSYLLALDASSLKEVGRAEMAGPMAFGFHGAYKAFERRYAGDI